MYQDTLDHFAAVAEKKAAVLKNHAPAFWIGAMMAGAYVGLGIILIFSLGALIDPALRKLVMGATFGIALTLVVIAGSELFTGHTMIMTLGWLKRRIGFQDLSRVWPAAWAGNFAGSALLAGIFVVGGGASGATLDLINSAAAAKMGKSAGELFALGVLCNWLVCLALWMAARVSSDTAKCVVIFWCLLAFIASGYEHSVANMTLFCIALFSPHPEAVSLAGMAHNLLWVTLGNTLAGALFMALGYAKATPQVARGPVAVAVESGVDAGAQVSLSES